MALGRFSDFYKHYLSVAVFIVWVWVIFALVSIFCIAHHRDNVEYHRDFCAELEGIPSGNETAKRDAMVFKNFFSGSELKIIAYGGMDHKLRAASLNPKFIRKNIKEFFDIASGARKGVASTIFVPNVREYLVWYCFIACALVLVGCPLQFALVSWSRREHLLRWEVLRPWARVIRVFMFPTLCILYLFEQIVRNIFLVMKWIITGMQRSWSSSPDVRAEQSEEIVYHFQEGIVRQSDLDDDDDDDFGPLLDGFDSDDTRVLPKEGHTLSETYEKKRKNAFDRIQDVKRSQGNLHNRWYDAFLRTAHVRKVQLEADIESTRAKLRMLGEDIKKMQISLAETRLALFEWNECVRHAKEKTSEQYLRELELILKIKGVAAVDISSEKLYVYTDTIFIVHKHRTFEIGVFFIEFDMAKKFCVVSNLASTHADGCDHPYGNSGSICFGNQRDKIQHALDHQEFAVAVSCILVGLQTAEGGSEDKLTQWKEV